MEKLECENPGEFLRQCMEHGRDHNRQIVIQFVEEVCRLHFPDMVAAALSGSSSLELPFFTREHIACEELRGELTSQEEMAEYLVGLPEGMVDGYGFLVNAQPQEFEFWSDMTDEQKDSPLVQEQLATHQAGIVRDHECLAKLNLRYALFVEDPQADKWCALAVAEFEKRHIQARIEEREVKCMRKDARAGSKPVSLGDFLEPSPRLCMLETCPFAYPGYEHREMVKFCTLSWQESAQPQCES